MGQRTRTCAVIIHIHFAATHDRFSIRVRESEFRVDMPNAARFNAEGLLAGFGEDEPQAGWTERPIYDPINFERQLLGAATLLYTVRISRHMKRGWRQLFDGYEWDLTLPAYEDIPLEARRDYEKALSAWRPMHAFAINGNRTSLPPYIFRLDR